MSPFAKDFQLSLGINSAKGLDVDLAFSIEWLVVVAELKTTTWPGQDSAPFQF